MSGNKLAFLILGSIGGLFLVVGLVLLSVGRSQGQAIERLAAEPVLDSLAQLRQTSPGAVVLLQGKVAERNERFEQGFVAYVSWQYQGERCVTPTPDRDNQVGASQCESIWGEVGRETPALWLDLAEGRVQVANTDYRLAHAPVTWQSSTELIEEQTIHSEGFKIGSPVFSRGTVVLTGDTPTVRVEFLFGGDSQAYFEDQRRGNNILFLLGTIFMSVGAVALVVGAVIWWIGRKRRLA
jgi:hypothetical protein